MAKRVVLDALNKRREEMLEQSVHASPISASIPHVTSQTQVPDEAPVKPVEEEVKASPVETESIPAPSPVKEEVPPVEVEPTPEPDDMDDSNDYDPSVIDDSVNLPDMSAEAIDKFGFGDMSTKSCFNVSFKIDKFTYVWLSRVKWAYRQHGRKHTLADIVLYMMLSYIAKNFFYNRTLTSFHIKEDATLVRDRIIESKDAIKKLNWKEKSKRNVTLNVRFNGKVDYAVDYFRTLYSYPKSFFIYDSIVDFLNSYFPQLRPKSKDFPGL